jgi:glycosyltransferase involved in cell wall biosynthesis
VRILAVDPLGYKGHISFNGYFLRILRDLGRVALATFPSYHRHFDADTRIEIPERLASAPGAPKLALRIRQFRILHHILRNLPLGEFDAIVFLIYETISFAVRWPRNRKAFLFEHDNLDSALRNRVRMHFFCRLPANAVHLPFLEHAARRIVGEFGRHAERILHPHYRYGVTVPSADDDTGAKVAGGKKTIFSPCWSTPPATQAELKRFVSERPDYYLICKGPHEERTQFYEQQPFFERYESLLRTCDMVFNGARFDYRASGCAYEALSHGTPVVLLDCPFGRKLRWAYPGLTFLIDNVAEFPRVTTEPRRAREDHAKFLREHSYEAIRDQLAEALRG